MTEGHVSTDAEVEFAERDRLTIGDAIRCVTPLGWIVLVAGVVLLVGGTAFGWLELIGIGGVLVGVFAAAVPFTIGRESFGVQVELEPRRVRVGDRALGRLQVTNLGERRVLPTRLALPVGHATAEFSVPQLAPDETHEDLFAVPTSRRAVIEAGPARSLRGDPLGLLERSTRWTGVLELFVHPRTVRLTAQVAGLLRDLEGVTGERITDDDLAFHALRPYESGDDRRNIHWRTSARTGLLMVRQFQETRRSQANVLQTLEAAAYASEDEFELAVEVLASLTQELISSGVAVSALTQSGRLPTRAVSSMLDGSSRLEAWTASSPSLRDFIALSVRRLPQASIVFLVCGSATTDAQLGQLQSVYAADVTLVVFRCAIGHPASRTRLRETVVCTVPELDDLPRLVRETRVRA
ncbi:DUF58 domain-containing protein [Pseudoclavibacter sp. VKM Ac-2867]|uniref:DUF58 domain-containing protein n=1 Tax=Pseudoclavibacter sp. VKM Ac-2867 TaxID=2783829 RepID=UPI00188D29C9|nr:DUF58 domain-containing protein [Pseudoclavibacter sp. VKM Ac-2867]MBF4459723.1 DUF58 domain-containing protein [Pseudoclavibacter sp. VKM Ac-2867]